MRSCTYKLSSGISVVGVCCWEFYRGSCVNIHCLPRFLERTTIEAFTYQLFSLLTYAMPIEDLRERFGRFRILVIGRANAGKTTILKKICDSTEDPEIYDDQGRKVWFPF